MLVETRDSEKPREDGLEPAEIWLHTLRSMSTSEAREELLKLMGVGRKVADCILLMSLDKIAMKHYGVSGSSKGKATMNTKLYDAVSSKLADVWGEYAGWAHSVLFTSDLKSFASYGLSSPSPSPSVQGKKARQGKAAVALVTPPATPTPSASPRKRKVVAVEQSEGVISPEIDEAASTLPVFDESLSMADRVKRRRRVRTSEQLYVCISRPIFRLAQIAVQAICHHCVMKRSLLHIPMAPSQKAKEKEVAEPEEERPEPGDGEETGSEGSEDEPEPTGSSLPESSMPSTSSKKKKKKRSKAMKALNALRSGGKDGIPDALVNTVLERVRQEGGEEAAKADPASVRAALEQMKIKDVIQGKAGIGGKNQKDMGGHKFWATQPVPQLGEEAPVADGYIEPSKPPEEVRQEPYPLPKDFEWTTVDVNDPAQLREVYELLSGHYVEDDVASFRFQYSAHFLHWALQPPGYYKEWHVGVRVASNKKLVAFISGVPMSVRVRDNTFKASEVNFLCVHKKLRSKRLAPVLIKEITRQCHLKGVFQALYTAGLLLPTPIATCRYYHRMVNVKKLVEVNFTSVPSSMTMARLIRLNKLPDTPKLLGHGLREMEERDVPQVTELYGKYMDRFGMAHIMDEEEIRHSLLSGRGDGPDDA
ncbi:hypothetical protein EVJ58_g2460 [Rhodofomes roseus]|uniref:Glycylpeptide N-tetradecanoyltransferase n=1 Tax=Rhodofomes roseus TaxID=34475 RepID=A0A4Y9YQ45_9APHY|nr:hypothetical protein EVJ58_g2460 [Rhodofomes roseus]